MNRELERVPAGAGARLRVHFCGGSSPTDRSDRPYAEPQDMSAGPTPAGRAPRQPAKSTFAPLPLEPQPPFKLPTEPPSEVVDLPSFDAGPAAILSAVIRHQPGQLIECPVRPPMCDDATLAVDREHGLVLLAVAKAGLADFRAIAQAYQWLSQNRALIGMAVPQFSVDIHCLPQLRLLVDHRDMTADLLQPMLEAGHVTVQAYRKLRWGEKTGLLLEAA